MHGPGDSRTGGPLARTFPPRSKLDISGEARGAHGDIVDRVSSITRVGHGVHEPVEDLLRPPQRIIRITSQPSPTVHEYLGRDPLRIRRTEQHGDKTVSYTH